MARKKRKRIASRGSVNTTILKTLINGDKYGYEIIKEVEEYSEGKIVLKQPSLYSSLSRFEEKGIVSSYWGDSDIGGRRHYYHLTDIGHKYYNENVLKHKDEEDDDVHVVASIKDKPEEEITLTPVDKESIPAVLDFEVKQEKEIIPDHNFYTKTPIENDIKDNTTPTNSEKTYSTTIKNEEVNKTTENNEEYELIKRLATKVKSSNKRISTTPFKKLHILKPKKSQKVILDSDGIFKLRDEDYIAKKAVDKEKIVDNVIKRTNPTIYGYPTYTENKPTQIKELSEEEKKLKNQLFVEKFHNLTQSKIKIVEEKPTPQPIKEEKEIDYRSKLNSIIESNNQRTSPSHPVNNLFTYDDEEENKVQFEKSNNIEEDEEDKFIDFEPTEFSVKNQDTHYVEEISNYTSNTGGVTLNRYEHKSKPIADEKSYVLINKVRLVFGLILALFLVAELTISYFVFKHLDLLVDGDSKFFIVLYILSALLVLGYMIPYFINKSQHTYNNFKLKYAISLGSLAFLVLLILIYCINALIGFELDNFKYFAVKLIVPAILAFNFVIMPLIYSGIVKNKNFYD